MADVTDTGRVPEQCKVNPAQKLFDGVVKFLRILFSGIPFEPEHFAPSDREVDGR